MSPGTLADQTGSHDLAEEAVAASSHHLAGREEKTRTLLHRGRWFWNADLFLVDWQGQRAATMRARFLSIRSLFGGNLTPMSRHAAVGPAVMGRGEGFYWRRVDDE